MGAGRIVKSSTRNEWYALFSVVGQNNKGNHQFKWHILLMEPSDTYNL